MEDIHLTISIITSDVKWPKHINQMRETVKMDRTKQDTPCRHICCLKQLTLSIDLDIFKID